MFAEPNRTANLYCAHHSNTCCNQPVTWKVVQNSNRFSGESSLDLAAEHHDSTLITNGFAYEQIEEQLPIEWTSTWSVSSPDVTLNENRLQTNFVPSQVFLSELRLPRLTSLHSVSRYFCSTEGKDRTVSSSTLLHLVPAQAPRLLSDRAGSNAIRSSYNGKKLAAAKESKSISTSIRPVAVAANEPLLLQCVVSRGWPKVHVQWHHSRFGLLLNFTHVLGWNSKQLNAGWANHSLLRNWPFFTSTRHESAINQNGSIDVSYTASNSLESFRWHDDMNLKLNAGLGAKVRYDSISVHRSPNESESELNTNDLAVTSENVQIARLNIGPIHRGPLSIKVNAFALINSLECLRIELHVTNVPTTLLKSKFSCNVQNSFGSASTEFQLRDRTSPDAPNKMRAEQIADDRVRLQWTPGFDGGFPQQFRVQYFAKQDLQRLMKLSHETSFERIGRRQSSGVHSVLNGQHSNSVRVNFDFIHPVKLRSNNITLKSVSKFGANDSDVNLADAASIDLDSIWQRITSTSLIQDAATIQPEIESISKRVDAGNASFVQIPGLQPDTEYVFLVWAGNRIGWTAATGPPIILRTIQRRSASEASGAISLNERFALPTVTTHWFHWSNWTKTTVWLLLICFLATLVLVANSVCIRKLRQKRISLKEKADSNDEVSATRPKSPVQQLEPPKDESACANKMNDQGLTSNSQSVEDTFESLHRSALIKSAFGEAFCQQLQLQASVSNSQDVVAHLQPNGLVCSSLFAPSNLTQDHCSVYMQANPLSVIDSPFNPSFGCNVPVDNDRPHLTRRLDESQQLMHTIELMQLQPINSVDSSHCKLITRCTEPQWISDAHL